MPAGAIYYMHAGCIGTRFDHNFEIYDSEGGCNSSRLVLEVLSPSQSHCTYARRDSSKQPCNPQLTKLLNCIRLVLDQCDHMDFQYISAANSGTRVTVKTGVEIGGFTSRTCGRGWWRFWETGDGRRDLLPELLEPRNSHFDTAW